MCDAKKKLLLAPPMQICTLGDRDEVFFLSLSSSPHGWLGGVVVSVSDSRSRGRGFDSRLVHREATTLGKLLTLMCFCHQAVQFGTGQRAVMLCGREGNRRSGVTLAMRHRL